MLDRLLLMSPAVQDRAAAFCNRKSNVLRVRIRCDQRLEERQEFVSRHLRGSVDREIRAAGPLKLVEDRVSHPHVLAQGESSHRLSPHINVAIGKSLNQCIAQHRSINCRERTQRKCRPVPDVRIVIFRQPNQRLHRGFLVSSSKAKRNRVADVCRYVRHERTNRGQVAGLEMSERHERTLDDQRVWIPSEAS